MKVLLLSPDSPDRASISDWLRSRGYAVTMVTTAAKAIEAVGAASPRFALVDLAARSESLKFLRSLVTDQHAVWAVAIADRRDAGGTADALRLGAVDIITRPLHEADVLAALANAREFAGLAARPHGPDVDHVPADGVLTFSPRMREIYDLARRLAPSRCPVLLVGERGTGRQTLARMIHQHSPFAELGFWRISPGPGGSEELSEVWATSQGTIFIEELSELPDGAQADLACILSDAHERLPAEGPHGFRVIAAAQPHIHTLVDRRIVQRTLVEALSVLTLELPTLRERSQDIPPLSAYFLKDACHVHGVSAKSFSRSALALLGALPWHGNAGELKGLVERLAVLVPRGVILQEDVLQHVRFDGVQARGGAGGSLADARRRFEREFIASVLQRHQWRMDGAASELGIERTNLYRKIKQLGIVKTSSHN